MRKHRHIVLIMIKMRVNKLKWFGHIEKRGKSEAIERI